jgi:hypothetical protein
MHGVQLKLVPDSDLNPILNLSSCVILPGLHSRTWVQGSVSRPHRKCRSDCHILQRRHIHLNRLGEVEEIVYEIKISKPKINGSCNLIMQVSLRQAPT